MKKQTWREWVIFVEGVGPISGTNSSMRGGVTLMKRQKWPDNDLYQVRRVRLTLDPERRRTAK